MKKKKKYSIAAAVLSVMAAAALFADERPARTPMSYDSYVSQVSAALPEVKSNALAVNQAENAVTRAQGTGDVSVTGGYKYTSTDAYSGKTTGTVAGYDANVGVSKEFTDTGTTLSATADYAKSGYSDFSAIPPYSTYTPGLSLKVTQPLLYNFLGKVDSYAEKDAKMKTEIAKLKLVENNKSILSAYRKLYFQWMISIKVLDILDESVKNAKKQRDQVARNRQAGLSEDDDLQRSNASVLSYENQYQQYLTSLRNLEHQLSVYIDCVKNSPDEKEFNSYYGRSSDHAFDFVGFDRTNSAKVIDLTLKELDYSKGVGQNKLLPSLNVFAGITQKNMTTESSEAFSSYPHRDYSVGFEFSYKLGTSAANADLEDIRVQIQSLKYTYDSTLNEYRKSLMKIRESAEGTKSLIKNKASTVDTLGLQLAAERRKYSQGRLALSYVITTENSIASGKIDLLNLKYQLISYYIDYTDLVK
jgi:outer membrane protein